MSDLESAREREITGVVVVYGEKGTEKSEALLRTISHMGASVQFDRQHCTFCGLNGGFLNEKHSVIIEWDERGKTFKVRLAAEGVSDPKGLVRYLTFDVAQESTCSCGSTLRLENHVIRKKGGDFEFEGVYVCQVCSLNQRTGLTGLRRLISRIWKETDTIEVGPTGVTYKKKSDSRS
jgi:hypothetical protein